MISILLLNLAVVFGCCLLLWLVSLIRRDVSIVDIFWGTGFVIIAWITLLSSESQTTRSFAIVAMATLWGLRLSLYLAWRNLGKPEDYRYAAMREKHGARFPWVSLYFVFGLQGMLMWIISMPIQVSLASPVGWAANVWLGLIATAVGICFEAIGDWQLACFKAEPENRGKVLNTGLWRYTRHPNYFGDFMVWWGIYLMAMSSVSYWTIFSPIIMTVLLMRVSGVTLLESSLTRRVAGYEEYVKNTSAFFPLPPRRPAAT